MSPLLGDIVAYDGLVQFYRLPLLSAGIKNAFLVHATTR